MFSDKLKTFTSSFSKILENKKIPTKIIVIGCIGILLIGISDWFTPQKSQKNSTNSVQKSVEEYIEILEKKTQKMILSISGAGKSKIMITAENSSEKEFATDDDISNDYKSNNSEKQQSSELKSEIVIIDSNSGKDALVTKTIEPQIRGVLVLCEGADIPKVKENVTEAVKTILGIPYNKICVIKLNT